MRERFAQYYKVDLITLPLQSHSQLALRENQHPHWYHDKGPHSLTQEGEGTSVGEPFFTQGQLAMQAK